MKKIATLTMVALLLLGMFTFNVSAQENVSVYIDGIKIEFDVPARIMDGRTMVPLRGICEALGMYVDFNDETRQITITNGSDMYNSTFTMVNILGNKGFGIVDNNNFRTVESDVPTMTISGRTLVPVRVISESIGCNVEWENTTRSVVISSNKCYENTDVPTYTSVTGVQLKDTLVDNNGTIYRYNYTQEGEYNEFSDYIVQLVKKGWVEINKQNTGEMLIYYFLKNETTVMVGYVVGVDEIWVSVIENDSNINSIPTVDNSERIQEIEELIDETNDAIKDIKSDIKSFKKEISNIEDDINDLEETLNNTSQERSVRVFKNGSWVWETDSRLTQPIQDEIDELELELELYEDLLDEAESTLEELEDLKDELEDELETLK